MRRLGIGVQVNYLPVHQHPVFRNAGWSAGSLPVSENFYSEEISLPIHPNLTDRDQSYICENLANFLIN